MQDSESMLFLVFENFHNGYKAAFYETYVIVTFVLKVNIKISLQE